MPDVRIVRLAVDCVTKTTRTHVQSLRLTRRVWLQQQAPDHPPQLATQSSTTEFEEG